MGKVAASIKVVLFILVYFLALLILYYPPLGYQAGKRNVSRLRAFVPGSCT